MKTHPNERRARRGDAGFTIIEVIIAMLLLGAIVSGVALAFTSGLHVEQKRDMRSRMGLVSERVYEHLRSNKEWTNGCRRTSPTAPPRTCRLERFVDAGLLRDDTAGVTFQLVASATGIDNGGDGLGSADEDGNVDDFFRINLNLSIPSSDKPRVGNFTSLTSASVINGSATSKSGSLVIQVCGTANQVDERIQISGCPQSPTWFEMPDCADAVGCAPRSLFPHATPAGANVASRFVAVVPVNAPALRIRKADSPNAGMIVDSSASVRIAAGTYRFADLPTGTWQIIPGSYLSGSWIDWGTHHIPSSQSATVEKRRTANALIALKPRGASRPFQMNFERIVRERWLGMHRETRPGAWIPECESPASYFSNQLGSNSVTCSRPHMIAIWRGGSGGNAVLNGAAGTYSKYESDGYFRELVTVDWIEEDRRAQYIWQGAADAATYGTQAAPAGRFTIRTGGGPSGGAPSYSIPTWRTSVRRAPYYDVNPRGANTTALGVGSARFSGIPHGLNDPLTRLVSTQADNVRTIYGAGTSVSTNASVTNCDKRYLWVATSGAFSGGGCGSARMRGDDGECYTNMSGGWTGVNYTRRRGCSGIYWPPLRGTVNQPGKMVLRVCKARTSQVRNRDNQEMIEWIGDGGDLTHDQFIAYHQARGWTVVDGTVSWAGATATGLIAYNAGLNYLGTSTKTFSLGCETTPNVTQPLMCPNPFEWGNCSRGFVLTFPVTPAWSQPGGMSDGNRPRHRGNGMTALSG